MTVGRRWYAFCAIALCLDCAGSVRWWRAADHYACPRGGIHRDSGSTLRCADSECAGDGFERHSRRRVTHRDAGSRRTDAVRHGEAARDGRQRRDAAVGRHRPDLHPARAAVLRRDAADAARAEPARLSGQTAAAGERLRLPAKGDREASSSSRPTALATRGTGTIRELLARTTSPSCATCSIALRRTSVSMRSASSYRACRTGAAMSSFIACAMPAPDHPDRARRGDGVSAGLCGRAGDPGDRGFRGTERTRACRSTVARQRARDAARRARRGRDAQLGHARPLQPRCGAAAVGPARAGRSRTASAPTTRRWCCS